MNTCNNDKTPDVLEHAEGHKKTARFTHKVTALQAPARYPSQAPAMRRGRCHVR